MGIHVPFVLHYFCHWWTHACILVPLLGGFISFMIFHWYYVFCCVFRPSLLTDVFPFSPLSYTNGRGAPMARHLFPHLERELQDAMPFGGIHWRLGKDRGVLYRCCLSTPLSGSINFILAQAFASPSLTQFFTNNAGECDRPWNNWGVPLRSWHLARSRPCPRLILLLPRAKRSYCSFDYLHMGPISRPFTNYVIIKTHFVHLHCN